MFGADFLEERGFYRYGSLRARAPVHVWIGRIDEPGDLKNGAIEPVVGCIVMSMREGMPILGHAPFLLSAMLSDPHEKIAPLPGAPIATFDMKYRDWRREWDAGNASAWEDGPAEVYYQAIGALLEGKQR